jgi:hypothetical protein
MSSVTVAIKGFFCRTSKKIFKKIRLFACICAAAAADSKIEENLLNDQVQEQLCDSTFSKLQPYLREQTFNVPPVPFL